ncbi:MAG: DUF3794 and LysM peptidoglycan-binding domain-containing protein [Limnochordia bacterium]|jgi:hypothetical protein
MSLRLEEQQVLVETWLGSNTAQGLAQGFLQLPDGLPAVGEVLDLRGWALVDEVVITPGSEEALISGTLSFQMVYGADGVASEGTRLPIYSADWPAALDFSGKVEIPGIDPETQIQAQVRVESIDFSLEDNRREMEVEAILQFQATARKGATVDIISSAQGSGSHKIKGESKNISIEEGVRRGLFEGTVRDELTLPEGEPSLIRVIQISPRPVIDQREVRPNQGVIRGHVNYRILYWGEADGQDGLHQVELTSAQPFELGLELDGLRPGMELDVVCQPAQVRLLNRGTESLVVEVDLDLALKAYRPKQLAIINDLTGEGDLVQTRKDILRFDQFIGQVERQSLVERTLNLPVEEPRLEQVLQLEVSAEAVEVTVGEGKITVEGEAFFKLIYLTTPEEQYPLGVISWTEPVPFTVNLDMAGARPGMNGFVDFRITESRAQVINEEQVSIDCLVNTKVVVYETIEEEVVMEAVAIEPLPEDPPSITFVVVGERDTLWKLSRRYYTSEENIIAANPWLEEKEGRTLDKGWKLFIPRRKAQGV